MSQGDMETRARAVVAELVRRVSEVETFPTPTPANPTLCPNCDTPFESPRTPYCSDACKDESAFVRQFRASLANGALHDPDRQVALGQKLWRILGGGLPLRVSLIPPKALNRVLSQRENRCEICGEPSITVDNVGSG